MGVKKVKGTKVLKKFKKPYPEIKEIKVMELTVALDYLNKVHPGIGLVLTHYWEDVGVLEDVLETRLPLPPEGDELEDISFLVLEEYPEWEDIIFELPDLDAIWAE